MAVDLTGGIDPTREQMFAECPDNPEMRDSVSFWVSDDRGEVSLPRVGIEAVAANWQAHGYQVNVAFPDGRVLRVREDATGWPAEDPDGRPMVIGVGGLGFRCVEPFRTWTMTFDGAAVETSSFDLADGKKDGPLVDVQFEVEATMAVPPWVQGTLQRDAGAALETSVEGDLMGGPRYEQLFRAVGRVSVAGQEREFTGSGLRIRRQGVRRLAGFWGHCWQSALFPSGKAFGCMAYPPRDDGEPTFNEGFVYDGTGELTAARLVDAPWLTKLQPLGEDVSLGLETERGTVRIEGKTVVATFDITHNDKGFAVEAMKQEMPDFPALSQSGARYRWDGEDTYGMIERSYPLDKIARS